MENKRTCANCDRELDIGVDAIRVDEGVMGMKGFVPLEKTLLFCCEKCLIEYYDLGNLSSMPRRIP
jgi:hypothetical protein